MDLSSMEHILSLKQEEDNDGLFILEKEHEKEVTFLTLINKSRRTADLVNSAINFFKEHYNFEAVGVRLYNCGDYSYFGTYGFPKEFVRKNNCLRKHNEVGQFICNSSDNQITECMCSKVINKRFDPSKLFFTVRGSFWTNSTTELLSTTESAEYQTLGCNICNNLGYESMALIALQVDDTILGLLQFNDSRGERFSLEKVTVLERLAGYLAVSLSKASVEEFLLEAYETNLIQSEKLMTQSEELLKANELLRESEEKYRNIIETANEGIIINDAEGRITYVNKKIEDMFGYSLEDVIDRSMSDFVNQESEYTIKSIFQNGLQGISESFEIKFIRKNGSSLLALVNVKSLYNSDGQFMGLMSMLTDITERKQSQNELKESEIRFRALAENSPDIITRFDRQHRHVYANPAAAESYNIPLDEIIGKTQGELRRSHKNVKFWEEHLENTFVTGKTETVEYQYISPQGKKYYFNTKIVPEFADGKIISVLAISRDITDIREAEAKLKATLDNLEDLIKERTSNLETAFYSLKKSEKGLAEAQRMAHIGNWEWKIASDKMYWSEEMYRIYMCNPTKLAPNYIDFINYINPDECENISSVIKNAIDEKPFNVDFRITLNNGKERSVHMQCETIFDEKHDPIKIRGIVQDITERKKMEEKLRESEEKYRNIVETTNEGISLNDGKGLLTYVNNKMAKMLGYYVDEIIGKNILDFVVDIDDSVVTNSVQKQLQDDVQSYDFKLLRKDGSPLWVFVNIKSFFDHNGKFIGSLNMFTDVNERKLAEEKIHESEEKYRNIVETANEGIVVINKEATITFANKRMEEMLGYDCQQCTGKQIWDFLSEESKAIVKLKLENRWLGKEDSYELKLIKKDGNLLWVLVNSKGLFDKNGDYLSTLCMVTDITKRKEAEQTLANFEIAREKEIHHRIKNNFQIVSSLLDIQTNKFSCRNDIKELEVIDAFKECQSRVITMALIHEELYRGSRLENINFSEYIEKLSENLLVTYRLGNKDIKINRDLENDIFLDIDTAIPLGTLINELVTNSFKHAFIGKDKGKIWINLHREREDFINISEEENCEDAKSTRIILSVSDNGVGIPKNLDIENLDSLGLQLVTSLVDQLKGELEIKSKKGTEFIMRFTVKDNNNRMA
jgi:PAS domain S-box-containing protein